ncbi:DUF418 domain-containing protein [Bacillus xiapuensis]|uniref:DUF418 domain-containing protein n=1 Tax=Bacillus xiapuensis TaxID=2014075 RepID=UPI000C24131E|nr:DUF418 domain-containing protein [Bacillus xiapuensis]
MIFIWRRENTKKTLAPLPLQERVAVIDVLRGVALFGIIVANILWFLYPVYLQKDPSFKNEWTAFWHSSDYALQTLIAMFIDGKFIMLFSMLFGFGMVIMQERTVDKGLNFWVMYSRRLLALLIFGLVHAYVIWFGDILTDYAILGLLLLMMHRFRPRAMLLISGIVYGLYFLMTVAGAFMLDGYEGEQLTETERQAIQSTISAHQEGTLQELLQANVAERSFYTMRNGMEMLVNGNPFVYLFTALPYMMMFLFGAYVAKRKWVQQFQEHRKGFLIVWLLCLLSGGFFSWGLPFLMSNPMGEKLIQYVSSPLLTVFYAVTILFLYDRAKGRALLHWLSFPGRMALTNYIMQSVICTFLFGPFGFGVYGKLHLTAAVAIAIAVFILQVLVSRWWLSRFRYGPLERVWRSITYWRLV